MYNKNSFHVSFASRFVRRIEMKRCGGLCRSKVFFIVTSVFIAMSVFVGCPESESAYKLPESYKPDAVKITLPSADFIWPRSGGGFNARNVSRLEGPSSFKVAWEAKLGDGAVLSPVIDDQGRIYTGIIGGALTCLSPDGEALFTFGGIKENNPVADTLRSQPALGDNQIWLVTDGGLVCLDFEGKEIFRIKAADLPKGGLSSVALSPNGGLVATTRKGWIILFDQNCQPKATIKTKGSAASPASFNEDGAAFVACSDKSIYGVSKEGRLFGHVTAAGAFLSTPVIGEERLYAICMDANIYCTDYQGRHRWFSDLLFDPTTQSDKLKREDSSAMLGLYWSPMLRLDASITDTSDAEATEPDADTTDLEAGAAAESTETPFDGFDLAVPFIDRPDRLKDASILLSWINKEGDRKMRKVMATSFIAEAQFGAQPVMDSKGKIYLAWDNNIAVAKGKEILARYILKGNGKVSGSQLVVTKDKRVLMPMNDGRMICFEEAPIIDVAPDEGNESQPSETELVENGRDESVVPDVDEVTPTLAEKDDVIKFAKSVCKQVFEAEAKYYGEKMVLVGFDVLAKEGYLDLRYQTGEFYQLGVRATIQIDNSIPDYNVTIELPSDLGIIKMDRQGMATHYPPGDTKGIDLGFAGRFTPFH